MSPTLCMEQDICEFDIHQSQLFEKSLRGKPWCSFIHLPSGKHTENYGTSPFLIGKSTNFRLGHFQVRKLFVYQRVPSGKLTTMENHHFQWVNPL